MFPSIASLVEQLSSLLRRDPIEHVKNIVLEAEFATEKELKDDMKEEQNGTCCGVKDGRKGEKAKETHTKGGRRIVPGSDAHRPYTGPLLYRPR